MKYIPHPTDTSRITLSDQLKKDIDIIAKDIHERWAKERINGGWSYGDVYDKAKKNHPCLVPYEYLPEKEKIIDKATVEQTVMMLLTMGYKLEKEA